MIVRDQTDPLFDTTSGTQYLGLDGGVDQLFSSGDALTLGFSGPQHAVGLFVVGVDVQAGDFMLSVSAGSVMIDVTMSAPLLDDGEAFFLGLVETSSALGFTSATLASFGDISNPTFFWHLDDITTAALPQPSAAVPEPGTLVLFGTGTLGVVCWRRRKRARQSRGLSVEESG